MDNKDKPFISVNYYEGEDDILSCYLGKIFLIMAARKGYKSAWSNRYHEEEGFFLNRYVARSVAERRKTQGTSWSIHELPSMVLICKTNTFIITEVYTDFLEESLGGCNIWDGVMRPFHSLKTLDIRTTKIKDLIKEISSEKKRIVVTKNINILPADLPFVTHSLVKDKGYNSWSRTLAKTDINNLNRLIAHINVTLQRLGNLANLPAH